jgi:hypothetical protein
MNGQILICTQLQWKKNEWEKDDVKEFAKLLEQSERAWKPTKEELKTINVGAGQDEI